ncbi:hypothetical protein EI94DRAFT_1701251 [Lactarius quietus]|nr:hypothetical protein EI94DRAFT_1701251 [Lactarius quietus]
MANLKGYIGPHQGRRQLWGDCGARGTLGIGQLPVNVWDGQISPHLYTDRMKRGPREVLPTCQNTYAHHNTNPAGPPEPDDEHLQWLLSDDMRFVLEKRCIPLTITGVSGDLAEYEGKAVRTYPLAKRKSTPQAPMKSWSSASRRGRLKQNIHRGKIPQAMDPDRQSKSSSSKGQSMGAIGKVGSLTDQICTSDSMIRRAHQYLLQAEQGCPASKNPRTTKEPSSSMQRQRRPAQSTPNDHSSNNEHNGEEDRRKMHTPPPVHCHRLHVHNQEHPEWGRPHRKRGTSSANEAVQGDRRPQPELVKLLKSGQCKAIQTAMADLMQGMQNARSGDAHVLKIRASDLA